jgi:hypothetical protein
MVLDRHSKFSSFPLDIHPNTWYNIHMKQITETTFFDSLLGDTLITYTIENPWSGQVVMEGLSHEDLPRFVRYFAWMFAIHEDSVPVKKIAVSA